MSLESPTKIERLVAWIGKASPRRRMLVYTVLGLVLIVAVLFGVQKCSDWRFDRGVRKDKQKIANTLGEIANIKSEQANLALQEAEKRGELKKDMEDLANKTFGRDEAKQAANAALANFNAALASNSNVDRTSDDILKKLEELEK